MRLLGRSDCSAAAEQLRRVFNLIPEPVVVHRNRHILFMNRAGLQLWGARSLEDVAGKPVAGLLSRDVPAVPMPGIRGLGREIDENQPRRTLIRRLDGTLAEREMAEYEIVYDERAATLVIAAGPAAEQAQDELRNIRDWLSMVLSSMSDGLAVFDNRYRCVFMNRVQEERVREGGGDPASVLGKVIWEIAPHLSGTLAEQKLKEAMERRVSASFEEAHCDRCLEISLFPTQDGGVAALSRDITDHKRTQRELERSREALRRSNEELEKRVRERTAELAETIEKLRSESAQRQMTQQQLQRANELLTDRTEQLRRLLIELSRSEDRERQALAQVLHDELQQLLIAIKFRAEVLLRGAPNGNGTALRQILELVGQSIAVTRSLTSQLSPAILKKEGLISALRWLCGWMKEKYDLQVNFDAPEMLPPLGEELSLVLFKAARELLFNIVKHANVGSAALRMALDGGNLTLDTEDEGVGFDPAEKFVETPGSFGLASIKERLSVFGGTMEIASNPGKGTKVRISIPAGRADSARAAGGENLPEEVPQQPVEERGKIRLLVVDDHAVVRKGIIEVLQRQPEMEVIGEAADGEQAIVETRRLHPTTVLMDLSLPGISGVEATRAITKEMPEVHVIGLSMYRNGEAAKEMQEAGADGYIPKDCPIDQLIAAIYDTMEMRR